MKRLGMCWKCLEHTIVRDHHVYGYDTDETLPYCESCDRKAHNKARREGRCHLSSEDTNRKSISSYCRRSVKYKALSFETLSPNVVLFEELAMNLNTGTITVSSIFRGNNGHKLKVINDLS